MENLEPANVFLNYDNCRFVAYSYLKAQNHPSYSPKVPRIIKLHFWEIVFKKNVGVEKPQPKGSTVAVTAPSTL